MKKRRIASIGIAFLMTLVLAVSPFTQMGVYAQEKEEAVPSSEDAAIAETGNSPEEAAGEEAAAPAAEEELFEEEITAPENDPVENEIMDAGAEPVQEQYEEPADEEQYEEPADEEQGLDEELAGAEAAEYQADGVYNRLISLKSKFPEGKHWNHYVNGEYYSYADWLYNNHDERYADTVTDHACQTHNGQPNVGQYDCNFFDGGVQCEGFARKVFYDVFGQRVTALGPVYATDIRVGDYVNFSDRTHAAVVLSVNGNAFTVAECNYTEDRCVIHWGYQTYYKSQVRFYKRATNWESVNGGSNPTGGQISWIKQASTPSGTDARVEVRADAGAVGSFTAAGMEIYDNLGYKVGDKLEGVSYNLSYMNIWYNITEELGITLKQSTCYKYRFLCVYNGRTYYSPYYEFKTTGTQGATINEGTYIIKYYADQSYCLGTKDGSTASGASAALHLLDPSDNTRKFRLIYVSDGYYAIQNIGSGLVLDTVDSGSTDQTRIGYVGRNDTVAARIYRIVPFGNGIYAIQPKCAPFSCIDVPNGSPSENLAIQLYHSNLSGAQKWVFEKTTVYVPVTGVSLDRTTLEMEPGDTCTLAAAVEPSDAGNKAVTWSSSDASVASVGSGGTITAMGSGTAVITARTSDGGYSASCTVTVSVPVTGVSLDRTTLEMEPGDTCTLAAAVEPSDAGNKAVTWSSSDTSVASVGPDGTVTALKEGTARITVQAEGGFTASCTVSIPDRIIITGQPADVQGAAGETIVFRIAAESSSGSPLTYQWQYQGVSGSTWNNFVNAADPVLSRTLQKSWKGWKVRCVVTDGNGSSLASNTAVISLDPVSITREPASVTAAAGSIVRFSVTAVSSNNEALSYQWQYQGAYSSTWNNFAGGTSSSITKTLQKSWNGWKIRCLVSDESGNSLASDTVTVTVQGDPIRILTQPESASASVNEKVTFTVNAESSLGEALNYQWQYQGKTGTKWNNFANATKASMTKTVQNSWNGWKIRCVVTDESGNSLTSDQAVITVITEPIVINSQPASAAVRAGTNVTFTVKAASSLGEALNYQWQYQGKTSTKWTNFASAAKASMTKTVQKSWGGWKVRCVITDETGNSLVSDRAVITVIRADLVIVSQPESVTVSAGQKATFTVEAESGLGETLNYQWQYQGTSAAKWNNFVNAAEASMTKTVQGSWNGWKVRCVITDETGNSLVSDRAVITVE